MESKIHSTFLPPVWKKGSELSAVAEESYAWKNSVKALKASPPTSLHFDATASTLEELLEDSEDSSEEEDDDEERDDSELVEETEDSELSDEEVATTGSLEVKEALEEPSP